MPFIHDHCLVHVVGSSEKVETYFFVNGDLAGTFSFFLFLLRQLIRIQEQTDYIVNAPIMHLFVQGHHPTCWMAIPGVAVLSWAVGRRTRPEGYVVFQVGKQSVYIGNQRMNGIWGWKQKDDQKTATTERLGPCRGVVADERVWTICSALSCWCLLCLVVQTFVRKKE